MHGPKSTGSSYYEFWGSDNYIIYSDGVNKVNIE